MSVNLNLLNEMAADIPDPNFGYKKVELRHVKEGAYFKRKVSANATFIRNHYNRADQFGPACFSASDADDMNREIFLKPSTLVWVEV